MGNDFLPEYLQLPEKMIPVICEAVAERREKVFRKEDMFRLEEQLARVVKDGAELYLEGERASAQEVAWTCMVNEEAIYMPDYVLDDSGRIAQLRYDRVRQI